MITSPPFFQIGTKNFNLGDVFCFPAPSGAGCKQVSNPRKKYIYLLLIDFSGQVWRRLRLATAGVEHPRLVQLLDNHRQVAENLIKLTQLNSADICHRNCAALRSTAKTVRVSRVVLVWLALQRNTFDRMKRALSSIILVAFCAIAVLQFFFGHNTQLTQSCSFMKSRMSKTWSKTWLQEGLKETAEKLEPHWELSYLILQTAEQYFQHRNFVLAPLCYLRSVFFSIFMRRVTCSFRDAVGLPLDVCMC